MMGFVGRFFAFWYDFIVGDDWTLAAGVVIALALGALLARSGVGSTAWVVMPLAIVVTLSVSLQRAIKAR